MEPQPTSTLSPSMAPIFFQPVSMSPSSACTLTSALSELTLEVMEPAPMCAFVAQRWNRLHSCSAVPEHRRTGSRSLSSVEFPTTAPSADRGRCRGRTRSGAPRRLRPTMTGPCNDSLRSGALSADLVEPRCPLPRLRHSSCRIQAVSPSALDKITKT